MFFLLSVPAGCNTLQCSTVIVNMLHVLLMSIPILVSLKIHRHQNAVLTLKCSCPHQYSQCFDSPVNITSQCFTVIVNMLHVLLMSIPILVSLKIHRHQNAVLTLKCSCPHQYSQCFDSPVNATWLYYLAMFHCDSKYVTCSSNVYTHIGLPENTQTSGLKVIKLFHAQLNYAWILSILTIVGILTFISRINISVINPNFQHFSFFYELKFHAQLSIKSFITIGTENCIYPEYSD